MPLIEHATLLHDLLRPTASREEPPTELINGTPAGVIPGQGYRLPDGSDSLGGIVGSELSLADVLSRRRSVRDFGPEPARAADLSMIVDAGLAAERGLWAAGTHPWVRMTMLLAALNVTGLAPGLYLRATGTLGTFSALQRQPAWLPELRRRYADAPALVMVCGDAGGACRAIGERGYGHALVRAAAAGYAAWLRAISLGMAGTIFGWACPHVTASLAQAGVPGLWHLSTLAVGMPDRSSEGAPTL
jgi:hypothetical protein